MPTEHSVCLRLTIYGQVQGVGYRYAALQRAGQLGLSGWVCNLDGGEVEAAVLGLPAAVQAFLDWAHEGPPGAVVTGIACSPADPGVCATHDFRVLTDA